MWRLTSSAPTAATSREAKLKNGLNAINAVVATGRGKNMRPRRSRMRIKEPGFSSTRKRTEKWKIMR